MARPRKPTAEKKAKGTHRPSREGNLKVPTITMDDEYAPPPELMAGAKRYWNKYVKLLREREILTEGDKAALALLCNKIVAYRKMQDVWSASPDFDDDGQPSKEKRMLYGTINSTDARIQSLLVQFSLTPGARSGAMKKDDPSANPMSDLL